MKNKTNEINVMKRLIAKENVEDINFHFHTRIFLTHITYITHTKNIDFSLAPKLSPLIVFCNIYNSLIIEHSYLIIELSWQKRYHSDWKYLKDP